MMLRKPPSMKKTIAKNRVTKSSPGMKAMKAMSSSVPSAPSNPMAGMMAPPSMGMKKGGAAKKGKMGVAIVIAIGKPKKGK